MSKSQIEKTFGVYIVDDSYYNPLSGRFVKAYRIYSADGCRWDTGFRTLKAVHAQCVEDKDALLSIKHAVEARTA